MIVVFLVVTACTLAKPAFIDDGNLGKIVIYDDNQNGVMDAIESGVQVKPGISQDISCPPASQEKNHFYHAG